MQIRAARNGQVAHAERLCGPGIAARGRDGLERLDAVPFLPKQELVVARILDAGRVDHPVLAGRFGERDGGSHGASGPWSASAEGIRHRGSVPPKGQTLSRAQRVDRSGGLVEG